MNIIAFVISLVLFVGGIVVMGYASSVTGLEAPVFFAGIIITFLGIFIPVHVLKRIDG